MFYKLLKKPFFGRFMVEWKSPLTEEQSKEWYPVTVKSKSGGQLRALFSKAKTNPKATIVLGHPMGKEAKGYFLKSGYAEVLLTNGYNVIVFDINGFGESSHGNFNYFDDIIAIGKKAKMLSQAIPVGYHGVSLGGQWATLAFTDKNHPYKFAIIESAATSLDEFWKPFPAAYRMLKILNFFLPRYVRSIKMIDRIKEVKNLESLLLIYSKSDELVPVQMGERFLQNSPVSTELWTVENAKHAAIMKSEDKEKYIQKILSWFESCVM